MATKQSELTQWFCRCLNAGGSLQHVHSIREETCGSCGDRRPVLTREQAIGRLVELDVVKWGEGERDASRRLRSTLTHGRALNALAHYNVDHIDETIARQARAVMTDADRRDLRQGG